MAVTARERMAGMAKQSAYLQRREAELIRFPDRYPNAKKIKYGR